MRCEEILNKFISSFERFCKITFGSVDNVHLMEPFITKKAVTFLNILSTNKQQLEEVYNGEFVCLINRQGKTKY